MDKIHIHYFQHVPFESLGAIHDWIVAKSHHLSSTKFYEDYQFPDIGEIDWLVIMGGPMGVYEEDQYPWLKPEKDFIRKAIEANKTVIGICLGAQLIASALGAKVYPNKLSEIGWYDIKLTDEGKKNVLAENMETRFKVFHWHGDTFDLPMEATHLFTSDACANQAFLYKGCVLGLQFHFEATDKSIIDMLENVDQTLIADTFVQTKDEIMMQNHLAEQNNQRLFSILNHLEKV